MGWQEEGEVTLSREDMELLTCLGVQMGKVEKAKSARQHVERPENLSKYICDLCDEVITNMERHFKNMHDMTDFSAEDISTFCQKITDTSRSKQELKCLLLSLFSMFTLLKLSIQKGIL